MMSPSSFLRAAALTAIVSSLGGCTTLFGAGNSSLVSAAPGQLSPAAATAIATDLVGDLTGQIGPGKNTIVLKTDGSSFGSALEQALKSAGYAVVTDQPVDKKTGIALAYVIDDFDGGVLARLSTPTLDVGRAYQVTATGATPTSPLSVMESGAPA
jgi:hypothetical protein